MKKLALVGLLCIFIGLVIMRQDDIITIINTYFAPSNTLVTLGDKNEYYRDYDFEYVQNTDNFSPNNKQDIVNIFYTAINAGKSSFTFYCPKEYEDCIDDVRELANNQDELSDINNFVHPYNGFSHIETEINGLGKITINIFKNYKTEDILVINQKIDLLYPRLVNSSNNIQNIRNVHDYIINNSRYDSNRSEKGIVTYKSDIAYGPLFEGYGICGGYADLMELYLEKMGIKSFKVSSNMHVWNAVYLNNNWYHLDLTWDDPVASDGNDYLEHDYFLVNTSTLLKNDLTEHDFNQDIYKELKEA